MKKPLSYEEFKQIYSKVPRLNVETIVKTAHGVLLTQRTIEPYKGMWHIPGGTIYFGETFEQAVRRVVSEETGLCVTDMQLLAYVEYPSVRTISVFTGWPLGVAFLVSVGENAVTLNEEAAEYGYFTEVPDNIIPEQASLVRQALEYNKK